jgi:hypothetical protein|tara:strand:+ start:1052 stop:1249 length:198 start_codon:yes stop_codon:yes gene_type:complete
MEDALTFAYAILKSIESRIQLTQENILHGSPQNMESYKQLVGELTGLEFTQQEVKDQLERMEKEE